MDYAGSCTTGHGVYPCCAQVFFDTSDEYSSHSETGYQSDAPLEYLSITLYDVKHSDS